jgi:putative peptide zinc metalloprotease protein
MSTTAEVAASSFPPARPRAEVLRRADGIELIGEFEDSGFKEPPHLARRADGQVVQLTELLYGVAEAADGKRDLHEVAVEVSLRYARTVTAENVALLADKKLRPLGVLALRDGTTPELRKREPLMALRHRKPLLPERAVNAGARLFTWLHRPAVTLTVLLAVAAFDAWLFGVHGIAAGLRSALYNPTLLLAVIGSVVVATIFHEFGHASACRYGGARPGVMGVGLYLVWPAFYCDVTDAYRLDRRGRLRTDLGGIYFNSIFALGAGGVYLATGEEAALLAAFVQHVIMLQQLLPLLRFDGYYVLTDLTGVPDILSRIKPIFRSLVRGVRREPKVAELKSWVRVVVTGYLVILIPALLFLFASMVMSAPRLLATVHDSLGLQADRLAAAAGPAEAGVDLVGVLALIMPVAAMSLSVTRVTRMTGRGLIRWSRDSAPRRAVAVGGAAALIGAVGYVWWPNGDYQPIRPGERGTLGEALEQFGDAPGGRPSFTPERETMYAPVATVRQEEEARREGRELESPAPGRQPSQGDPNAQAPNATEQQPGFDDEGSTLWPESGESEDYSTGDGAIAGPAPGGTSAPPGTTSTTPPPAGTATEPAPGTTTSPAPPPSDSGTTTTEPPPPTTSTDSTTTAPDTTTTPPPDSTTTAPDTTDSTETTPLAPESTTTSPDATTTAPDTTLTDPTTTETTPTP